MDCILELLGKALDVSVIELLSGEDITNLNKNTTKKACFTLMKQA